MPANALSEAARSLGVVRCLPALQRLSHASLSGATAHDIVVDWDRAAPDVAPFFGLMGVVVPGSGVHATSLLAAPDAAGGCNVLAERIAWAPKACASVRSEELSNHQAAPLLPGMQVLVHPSDAGSTVSLLDAGPGCLVIRRYVAYRWKEPALPSPAGQLVR